MGPRAVGATMRSVAPAIRGQLPRMRVRWIGLAALCAATATCGTLLSAKFDQKLNDKYGKPNPATFDQRPAPAPGAVSYERQIRPLLERRCVVCHACYDAPCQLKLESWDGIARGASKEPVYKARGARGRAHPAVPGRRLHVGAGASAASSRC